MDNTKGATTKSKDAAEENFGITKEQMDYIAGTAATAAATAASLEAAKVSLKATSDFLAAAQPEIEARTEEVASRVVANALARKQKIGALKQHGTTALVSAAVFIAGTAAMFGVDKYRHRNDKRANAMNPQYQGSQT